MGEREINPYMVQKYLRTLVSLFRQDSNNSDGQLASQAAASKRQIPEPNLPQEQEKKLLVAELEAKIRAITNEIKKTEVSSPADRKQLRKIETKLDIYRFNLEKLEEQAIVAQQLSLT